jgi:hypothetical protein
MAASISEQARQAFLTALTTPSPIGGLDATRFTRAREDPYSADEDSAVNIKADDEQTKKLGTLADDNELLIDVEYYVRGGDAVWETKADALSVAGHARIRAFTGFPPSVAQVRKVGQRWGGYAADRTPGLLTVKYAVRFLTSADALDGAPVA